MLLLHWQIPPVNWSHPRAQIGVTLHYDSKYEKLAYPGGDVAPDRGVCTDVVVRAYRGLGIDLQQRVHTDMRAAWSRYPKHWGLTSPDRNIDHRRVPNLEAYFRRHGTALPRRGFQTRRHRDPDAAPIPAPYRHRH
jgi:uncharacterized protein YijF (DUF1287 family)